MSSPSEHVSVGGVLEVIAGGGVAVVLDVFVVNAADLTGGTYAQPFACFDSDETGALAEQVIDEPTVNRSPPREHRGCWFDPNMAHHQRSRETPTRANQKMTSAHAPMNTSGRRTSGKSVRWVLRVSTPHSSGTRLSGFGGSS